MTFKQFIVLEENKKAYWQGLNWLMAFGISFIAYVAGDGVGWAVAVLPFARVASEMITRYFNRVKALGAFRE